MEIRHEQQHRIREELQGNRTFGLLYPQFDTYTTSPTKMAKAGDVIMSVRAPVGDLNYAPFDFCLGRGVYSIRSRTDENVFLFYLLKNNVKRMIAGGNGTVFSSVNSKELTKFELAIPGSEHERTKIATFLDSLDRKIVLNNRLNDYLAA